MHPASKLPSRCCSELGLKSFVEPPDADPHVRVVWGGRPQRAPLPDYASLEVVLF